MAVKTIKVDITGLDKIANAEKSISSLRNAVLGIEKDLKGMSGRRNSPLSFYIELKFNEDKVKQDYLKIKNMIENIPINVKSREGRVDLKQSNRIPRDSGYVRVRDQDYQSWRNLHKAIGDVSTASLNLMNTMTRLGAVNPAKGLLSVFNQINSKAMELHGNLMNIVGGKLQGGLQSAISGVLNGVRSGISQITQETENIGNAMQVFRVNMGALGFDDKEINKAMKRLGDYGKATVFDASDLLEQASTYYSYDRKDAEEIVKGISGLVAQTKDPVQGLKSVGVQVSQMLAAGVLNQQDFRFMRERFSALGASEINARLTELAKSKGENTIVDATRKRLITSDEVLDIFKEVGNSEKFQSLVTSILTPRQALENLKETLGNLFVFDQIDDDGNATPGALNKVYVATRDFIKGITEIVGTDTFEKYVKRLGDSIGTVIQKVNQFGKVLQLRFGRDLLSTINAFSKDFLEGIKGLDIGKIILNSVKDVMTFFNTNGNRIGSFLKTLITNISELGDTALSVATDAISGGLLDAIAGIVKIYDNIGKLAVNSGAVKTYANAMVDITNAFNKVLEYAQNLKSLQSLALSIRDFISTVTSVASNFIINTGVIDNLAQVIEAIVRTLSTVLAEVGRNINYARAQSALKQITDTIKSLLRNIEPVLEEIIRSAINVATSQAGVNFFKAVANFVQAVVNAIKQTLVSIGGSVEGGLTKLLNIVTGVVDFASKVAGLLGLMGKYVIMGFVATKFVTWATGIISSLSTVATAMSSVTNGRVTPFGGRLGGFPYEGGSGKAFYGAGADPYGGMLYPLGTDVARPTGRQQRQALWNRLRTKASSVKSGIVGIGTNYANEYNAILDAQGRPSLRTNVLSKSFRARLRMDDGIGDIPKNAGKYLLSRGKASGGAFLKVTKDLAKQGGNALVNGFKNSGVARVGALMLGDMAIQGFNGIAQSSDWSPEVKRGANLVASTASSAITGAMLGSAVPVIGTGIGALVGGAFGAIQGIIDNNNQVAQEELDKQAQKEVEAQQKKLRMEQVQGQIDNIKELARETTKLQDNYFSALLSSNSTEDALGVSQSFLGSVKSSSNGDLTMAQNSLGLAINELPKNINDYFVELNGKLVQWTSLKEQTGLNDKDLLATIQNLYATLGKPFVEFKDQAGTVIDSVSTLSEGEQQRRNTELQSFIDSYSSLGLRLREGLTSVWGDIGSLRSKLEFALNGSNFNGDKDQADAILKAIEEVGFNIDGLTNSKLEELKQISNRLLSDTELLGKSVKESNSTKLQAIKDKITQTKGEISDELLKKLESFNGEQLDNYLAGLKDVTKSHDKVEEDKSQEIGAYREKLEQLNKVVGESTNQFIKGKMEGHAEKATEAFKILSNEDSSVFDQKGAVEDIKTILNDLGIKSTELQNKIIEKVANGTSSSLQNAIEKVAQETKENAPTELISQKAQELYNTIGKYVADGSTPLETAKERLAGYDPKSVDTNKLDTDGKNLYDKLDGTIKGASAKIREGADKATIDTSSVDTSSIDTAKGSLLSGLKGIADTVASFISGLVSKAGEIYDNVTNKGSKKGGRPKFTGGIVSAYRELGGIIPEYHSKGLPVGIDWKTRGTDTVPTMLTPGEYVLRKKAVDSLGTNFLNNLNKYGAQALQSVTKSTIINNVYNTNNAKINQTIDNKSEYLNGMYGVDKLMRYV